MKDATPFVVSQFTNPSGEVVFRVYGWLDGKRVRKNFPTRAEANAERDALEAERMGADTGLRRALTRLTEEQLHEAETLFARLKEQPKPLSFYVEYALKHYNPAQREMTLPDAIADYTAFKEREQERGIISRSQTGSIKKELKLLQAHFGTVNVDEITAQRLGAFVERGKPSLKYVNNRRGLLSTFFKYAYQQDWVSANPIEKVRHYRIAHRRGSAKTMTAAQCRELMAYVEEFEGGRLAPYFALCLFAGIRPCVRNGEILKLKPTDVRLDTGTILIEPEVSKVKMKRTVEIQPNLATWLRAYPLDRFPIVPPHMQKLRARVAKKFDLTKDVMRHTFISMFVAKFRSMGEAALQAGNSESIIRKHYLDLKSKAEAEEFFAIVPQREAKIITLPSPPAVSRMAV